MSTPPSLPSARPKSLMVFGVINILFGAYCVMTALAGVFMMLRPEQNADNPVIQVMQNNATYASYQKVIMIPGILAVFALLFGGIGLVKARNWGRKLSIIWAWFIVLTTPVTTWMHLTYVQPAMLKQMSAQMPSESSSDSMIQAMNIGMTVVMIVVAVLIAIYGIVMIAMLSRQRIRAYCEGR